MAFSGAWRNQYQVAIPAPLGKADYTDHLRTDDPVNRDDAPQMTVAPDWISREEQLAALTGSLADPRERSPHSAGGVTGSHLDESGSSVPKGAPPWADYQHRMFGGDHTEQPVKGSAGAAHGGLRADNSAAWANPEGFDLGKEYTPVQPLRPVWNGRIRAMLRAFTDPTITDGTQSQPPPDPADAAKPMRTSPFDLSARVTRGHGTTQPTQRHTTRPNEGDVNDNLAFPLPQTSDPGSVWVM